MSKMIIVEGNSNDKDNVRAIMVKGEKGDQGDLNNGDIIDNLTSTATTKVLSANQGKVLKDLIDANETEAEDTYATKTGLTSEITARTNADNNLQSQINGLASGSPLVASSVSGMTDTSRIYVNSTDGHWYWYNGTTWTDGGIYQAIQNGENSIKYMMLDTNLQEGIIAETLSTGTYSTSGEAYVGDVGDTISLSTVENAQCGVMSVSEGDIIICPYVSKGNTSYNALIFTDSNDKIISTISKLDILSAVINNGLTYKTIVPRYASKLYFNNTTLRNEVFYPYKISKYNYFDKRITNSFNLKEKLEINETLTNKIYSTYSFNLTANNFKTEIYNVTALDKIRIETIIPADSQFVPALFFDDDGKPVGLYPQFGTTSATPTQFDMIVPANATKLYICTASTTTNSVYKYRISDKYKLNVTYNNGKLTLTNLLNGNYIEFNHFGGNSLFMIEKYKVGSTVIETHTDMVPAPYIVKAINNEDGDDTTTKTFTGGNHQYNNQGSGSTPTARQISLSIYADNNLVTNNSSIDCNEVTIIETNRVQGYNTRKADGTGREILEEKIVFKFDGTKLSVINTITPLEEILIERYYGIQTALFTDSDYKIYADKVYTSSTQGNVPTKPSIIYGSDIISSKLFDEGLGDYRYNNSNIKANISNSKSYYVPIYNNTTNFNASNINYIRGEYILDKNQI